jgi:hypothetical protein
LARKIAYALKEGAAESGVFPAYYEYCSPREFQHLCEEKGFTVVDVDVMYFQSSYFYFFFPLAMVSLCYEWFISRLSLKSLSAHVLVCAHKPKVDEKTISVDENESLARINATRVFSGEALRQKTVVNQKSSEL